jgi:hypothetical protein
MLECMKTARRNMLSTASRLSLPSQPPMLPSPLATCVVAETSILGGRYFPFCVHLEKFSFVHSKARSSVPSIALRN